MVMDGIRRHSRWQSRTILKTFHRCEALSSDAGQSAVASHRLALGLAIPRRYDPNMASEQPNILWICTDQQRYDTVHCLGNPHIHTPVVDRLCAEGVAFSRAYCQSPVCQPSRASFLTGLYPNTAHVNRNGNAHFPANERVRLITRRLADRGYDCGLAGKLHIASCWTGVEPRVDDGYRVFDFSPSAMQFVGRGNAYTDWLSRIGRLGEVIDTGAMDAARNSGARYRPDIPPELHQTAWCADRAIAFMEQERSGPWLMSVNIFDPHGPFDAPLSYQQRYLDQDLPDAIYGERDADTQERLRGAFFQQYSGAPGDKQRRQKASYYGMIDLIDEQVGRMLEALSRTGQRDNTVVIFMSDHGEMLGDHGLTAKGCRFYEGAVRVPLIVSWPGRFRQGVVADGLVELTDVAPTLAELTGEPLSWTNGRSLLPILTGDADPAHHRDHVRTEYYDALNMYLPQEPGCHTPCWATMYRDERHKLVSYHGLDYGELYDLERDPLELTNLWEAPAAATLRAELTQKSFDATVAACDPGPAQIGRF